jgi:phosphohistidine phosphatase
MRLILVRHAEAVSREADGVRSDFDRPLTDHGRAQALTLATTLKARGVGPELILTSPLVRAVQTGEPLVETLTPGKEAVVTDWLAQDGLRPKKLSRFVVAQGADPVILVGHEPDLSEYAAWLLDGEDGCVEFEKAGAACIFCPHTVARGGGTLEWLVPPTWFMPAG